MWTFNPEINRGIKLPPSMMSLSCMDSDFSNDDLAKADRGLAAPATSGPEYLLLTAVARRLHHSDGRDGQ